MNSLFSDLFKEFWRGILGGVRDFWAKLGEVSTGQIKENKMTKSEKLFRTTMKK